MSHYDRLVSLIRQRHDKPISEKQAHRLARNLVGYCDLVIKVNTRNAMRFREWLNGR